MADAGAELETKDNAAVAGEGGSDVVYDILLCYLYTAIPEPQQLADWFTAVCAPAGITGRVLVSPEGINVNVASKDGRLKELMAGMDEHEMLGNGGERGIDYKLDTSCQQPFPDLAIKLTSEVVATGASMPSELLFEHHLGGTHLAPEDFHAVLDSYLGPGADAAGDGAAGEAKKPLVVIDVRNRKEIEFGKFEGSTNSDTKMFSEWAAHFAEARAEELKASKVLMYCTGGVRCEKASAFLRSLGVEDVSQLSGGIHRYLERYGSEGYFKGSNFVFDSRGLQRPPGAEVIAQCFGCGEKDEQLSSDRVCAVCRDTVVMCDGCRAAKSGVYFCKDHAALEGSYFPYIDTFGAEELRRQQAALEEVCSAGGLYGGHECRGRRRAIRKQLKRIHAALAEAGAGEAEAEAGEAEAEAGEAEAGAGKVAAAARCRSCGLPCKAVLHLQGHGDVADAMPAEELCQGTCWGFFQPERRAKGYVDLDAATE